ncbi:hypothetical protein C0992_000234 [Termitomyces sp. T32_za158]|nr:hypothetical protein C0992_000234 [Termitomyces sp. T32_za158]
MNQPALHVRVQERVTVANIGSILPTFRALPPVDYSEEPGITEESYDADSWVSLKNARENFSPELGGPEGFDRWVISSMMINPTEAYGTHNTITKIWQKFTSTFQVSMGLIRFAPIFPDYVREFLKSSIEDGISYVEARINFLFKCALDFADIDNTLILHQGIWWAKMGKRISHIANGSSCSIEF